MGAFDVYAYDINTNSLLTPVQASALSFNVRINDAGDFTYNVNLADPRARASAQVLMGLAGIPFKTIITANAGQSIIYSGIAWQTTRSPKNSCLQVGGKALTSYFNQITLANDYTTAVAPGQLIANAVNDAQNVGPGANRGITPIITGSTTPPNITPAYHKNQYTTVAQILADTTAAITPGTGGTDYYMADSFINGAPTHRLMITSPRAGRDQNSSGLSVNLMQATDWTWPVDNMQSGNHLIVVGSGTGGSQPVALADDSAPRGGLGQPPRLDMVLQYSQIASPSQLQTIANGDSQRYGKPIATPTVTIPATYAPCQLGAFQIGDDIKLWSGPSAWFPAGLAQWWRIVAYKVDVPDAGVPLVTLTLNLPPVF